MARCPTIRKGKEERKIASAFFTISSLFGTCARYFPVLRDLGDCETLPKTRRSDFDMSSLAEIQEAIEKLALEDRARLREWFDAQDAEETDELLAAIDEGIRSAETERNFSLEEVRAEIKKWATKSA